nr:hypothetical protein [Pedobacter sp. Leaf132]
MTPMQRADFYQISNPSNMAYGSYKTKAGQSLEQFAIAIKDIGRIEDLKVIDLFNDPSLQAKKLIKFERLKIPGKDKYKNYHFKDAMGKPFDPKTDDYPYPSEAEGMTYDGLHPSDKGNAVIAKRLLEVLKPISVTK